ncbi:MAG TPA: cytochrome c [Stellaceae bacterium]|nr:cytochrome c [Stellaceae bacterium]
MAIYAGAYNVAADDTHWGLTLSVLETARTRSIQVRAAGIKVPTDLDDPAKLAMGVEHFAAHCAVCHGAPGVPRGEIAKGMYPAPPDLAHAASRYSDAELFWILKHGIKMTGMPSWADHGDDELWATVAFLKKSGMSATAYGELVKDNLMHGMQHHPRGEAMPGMSHGEAVPPAADAPHRPNPR